MIGKIFITREGYDPQLGKHVKDPYLGDNPSIGACRPDIRRLLKVGDHIFTISGRIPDAAQFVMGGFEVAAKINGQTAYKMFPEQRLQQRPDGQLAGNIICDAAGAQHELDDHSSYAHRIENYIVGKNGIALLAPKEIALGREQTLDALREILKKNGASPWQVVGRFGSQLDEVQVHRLREWLLSLKEQAKDN